MEVPVKTVCRNLTKIVQDKKFWWKSNCYELDLLNKIVASRSDQPYAFKVMEGSRSSENVFFGVEWIDPFFGSGGMLIADYVLMPESRLAEIDNQSKRPASMIERRNQMFEICENLQPLGKEQLVSVIENWRDYLDSGGDDEQRQSKVCTDPAIDAGESAASSIQVETIQQSAFSPAVVDGLAVLLNQADGTKAVHKASAAMFAMLKEDNSRYDWTADDWASNLHRSKPTIIATDAWTHILGWREERKQSLMAKPVSVSVSEKTGEKKLRR